MQSSLLTFSMRFSGSSGARSQSLAISWSTHFSGMGAYGLQVIFVSGDIRTIGNPHCCRRALGESRQRLRFCNGSKRLIKRGNRRFFARLTGPYTLKHSKKRPAILGLVKYRLRNIARRIVRVCSTNGNQSPFETENSSHQRFMQMCTAAATHRVCHEHHSTGSRHEKQTNHLRRTLPLCDMSVPGQNCRGPHHRPERPTGPAL
jgi:hypothetical protein